MFARLCADNSIVVAVSRLQFRAAARFADQHQLSLRAGDALHLAVCADHGATLCTLGRRLKRPSPRVDKPACPQDFESYRRILVTA
jgi:uncharacterized protein